MLQKKDMYSKLEAQLKREFNMKNLGEAKKILGMDILDTEAQADFGYHRRTMF